MTMIFPLANYFEVSVDELMGYNSERIEQEIKALIKERNDLFNSGKMKEGLVLGEALVRMREELADERISYVEYIVYNRHVYKLVWTGCEDALLAKCIDQCLAAAKRCDELVESDEIFRKLMTDKEGKVTKLLPGLLDFYQNSDRSAYVKMREMQKCAKVLEKYVGK